MVRRRATIGHLEEHVVAIGYLCLFFSHLEFQLDQLIGILLDLKKEPLRCLTNPLDIPRKISIAKHLGFLKKPNDGWYEDFDLLVWAIENWICPKRNRIVHDQWISSDDGVVVRLFHRSRIEKIQSWKASQLTTTEVIPHTADEIWDVFEDITGVAFGINRLSANLKHFQKTGQQRPPFPQELRGRWIARRIPPKESRAKESPSQPQSARVRASQKSAKQRRLEALGRAKRRKP